MYIALCGEVIRKIHPNLSTSFSTSKNLLRIFWNHSTSLKTHLKILRKSRKITINIHKSAIKNRRILSFKSSSFSLTKGRQLEPKDTTSGVMPTQPSCPAAKLVNPGLDADSNMWKKKRGKPKITKRSSNISLENQLKHTETIWNHYKPWCFWVIKTQTLSDLLGPLTRPGFRWGRPHTASSHPSGPQAISIKGPNSWLQLIGQLIGSKTLCF